MTGSAAMRPNRLLSSVRDGLVQDCYHCCCISAAGRVRKRLGVKQIHGGSLPSRGRIKDSYYVTQQQPVAFTESLIGNIVACS